jgi:hypothetical protein
MAGQIVSSAAPGATTADSNAATAPEAAAVPLPGRGIEIAREPRAGKNRSDYQARPARARDNATPQTTGALAASDKDVAPVEAMRQGYRRLLRLGGGLDITV